MNIQELEASFQEIDERDAFAPVDADFLGPSESSSYLRISTPTEGRAMGAAAGGGGGFLLEVDLKDVDISDDYIKAKLQASIANKFADLPGVKVMQIGATADYEVVEDYTYDTSEYSITALKGFRYDRASIPRNFWVIISKDDLSMSRLYSTIYCTQTVACYQSRK